MSDKVIVDPDGAWDRLALALGEYGFAPTEAGALRGTVSEGLTTPATVDLTPSDGFPFTPPTATPIGDTPRSWHRDPDGNLCLYSTGDPIGAPWLDAKELVDHITGWFRNNEAGWPDELPLLELDAYLRASWSSTTLLLEGDFEHGDIVGFTSKMKQFTAVPLVLWDEIGPMPTGDWMRLRGVYLDIGELDAPFYNWEEFAALLDPGEAEQLTSWILGKEVHFVALRYSRDSRVGHIALMCMPLDGDGIPLRRMHLEAVDEDNLTLRGSQVAVLRKRHITIVGAGGIGSFLADMLVRAGVRNLRLVDHDLLLPGNSIRHLAGRFEWGRRKVDAVKCVLEQHRPKPTITTHVDLISDPKSARNAFEGADLVIDATGHAWCTALLSQQAADLGTPLLITYIQRAGGDRSHGPRPANGRRDLRRRDRAQPHRARTACRVGLRRPRVPHASSRSGRGGGRYGPRRLGPSPWPARRPDHHRAARSATRPRPAAVRKRTAMVAVDPLVTARLEHAGARALPSETGGILVGYYETTGRSMTMTVTHCIEVPDPNATSTGFTLDPIAADALFQAYRARHDLTEPIYYVGDWHTHPCPQAASSQDLGTLHRLATGKRLPMAIIVLSWDGNSWKSETHVSKGHPWWRPFL